MFMSVVLIDVLHIGFRTIRHSVPTGTNIFLLVVLNVRRDRSLYTTNLREILLTSSRTTR